MPVTVSASVSGDVRMSMDHSGPIRGQYPGHVTTQDQSETSDVPMSMDPDKIDTLLRFTPLIGFCPIHDTCQGLIRNSLAIDGVIHLLHANILDLPIY